MITIYKSQIPQKIEDIEVFPQIHYKILKKLYNELSQIIKGKRGIMYIDAINLLAKNEYKEEIYNQIMVWCNYNIRRGNFFFEI